MEEPERILGSLFPDFVDRQPPKFRELFGDQAHASRFIAFSSEGCRRQIRRVGFKDDRGERNIGYRFRYTSILEGECAPQSGVKSE